VRAQVKKLVRDTGLPEAVALQVAKGEIGLAQAIADLARADQVRMLMRKHEISKGVANQVALGQTDLDQYLLKRRLHAYLEAHRERNFLESMTGDEVWLSVHGQRQVRVKLVEIGRYELQLEGAEGAESLHKLQLKIASRGGDAKKAEAAIELSPEAASAEPIAAPQDRYHLSDRRVMLLLESGESLCIRTLEGDMIHGHIDWFSRWEIGLRTRDSNTEVVVFRHAIALLERV
jgi:sRNA-binding regulator protein Hfq